MDGSNDFNPIKLHWNLHPDRGQEWRDLQTKVLGEKEPHKNVIATLLAVVVQ